MINKFKYLFCIFCFVVALQITSTNKSLAYSSDPQTFITEIVDDAKKILNDSSLSTQDKAEKLAAIALETVDINGISIYTLGGYRKDMSDDQLKKYKVLFKKYFLKSFTSRLTAYSDPKIDVLSFKVLNEKYTMVSSKLLATNEKPEVKIDWRVYTKNPANPLIRDVVIEGLSLARTQKEEFKSVIENNDGDISKLFITLENFITK